MSFNARDEITSGFIINPGTGPVREATETEAAANMAAFRDEVEAKHGVPYVVQRTEAADYGDGRFAFALVSEGERHEIQMPGLPLEQVRYSDDKDPWKFPRLYVDGDSWLWEFAVDVCTDKEDS